MKRWDLVAVGVLIVLYVGLFSTLTILQNESFNTTDHDLGVMDQAAWNTLHGRFLMESSQEGRSLSRLRGHVEPVFLLISLVYLVYDHVNALLILQTLIIALGAIPLLLLARQASPGRFGRVLGVAAAAAYLLYPPLEAANLTEFHPIALVPTFWLSAFYFIYTRKYGWYAVFALLALACKEDVSLTLAVVGPYLIARSAIELRRAVNVTDRRLARTGIVWGLASTVAAGVWLYLSLYVIVPAFSASGEYQLFQRYVELGVGPLAVVRTLAARPELLVDMLSDPARLSYVAGLLAGVGFTAVLSPATLLMAAPAVAVNLLSNYPVMYSGVSHYSAPVVPWVMVSAVLGIAWLRKALAARGKLGTVVATGAVAWLLVWSLGYQVAYGFTPAGARYRLPVVTGHNRLAARFLTQIPKDARLSTQPALYPHASHREFIYEFPIVADAEYVWLDVTSAVGMHPNDFRQAYDLLVGRDGFGLVDAADGYILLKRGSASPADLPDAFYDFARAGAHAPRYPVTVDFGDALTLIGYDLTEQTEDGQHWTGIRTYWWVRQPVAAGTRLYPFFFDDTGRAVEDTSQRPVVTALWYPPVMWRPGETLVMDKLPWPVGDRFGVGLGVATGGDWSNVASRLPVRQPVASTGRPETGQLPAPEGATWVYLATCWRQPSSLVVLSPARTFDVPVMKQPVGANLGGQVTLLGYDLYVEKDQITVVLYWQARAGIDRSYTVFLHLDDGSGKTVSQADGLPAASTRPTDGWVPGEVVADRRTLALPVNAPEGSFRLSAGMYLLETLERLPVTVPAGKTSGDSVDLGVVKALR